MKLEDLRRNYSGNVLEEQTLPLSPIILFEDWLSAAIEQDMMDAHAFVLSTVDENNLPDARVVLLKSIKSEKFIFYTNYESQKAHQLAKQNHVAMNFYWSGLDRQVRIWGICEKTSRKDSQDYFLSRPKESQISAIISRQSHVIANRAALLQDYEALAAKQKHLQCPDYWGGYAITPTQFEFFQGQKNRLHDRIRYKQKDHNWSIQRLAP